MSCPPATGADGFRLPADGGRRLMARTLFVTGTDTDSGKTHSAVALMAALAANGLRATGMKPVASGCTRTAAGWRNADALALQAASNPVPVYEDCNPFALPLATAPQLAARAAGLMPSLGPIEAAHARLAAAADAVVVEGVGGWMAPLADGFEQADLVRALDAPVVLVVGLRLGCLSHARLSVRALAGDGCQLAGWIGNAVQADFDAADGYADLLREAIAAPCLGMLPHDRTRDPSASSAWLDLSPLLRSAQAGP